MKSLELKALMSPVIRKIAPTIKVLKYEIMFFLDNKFAKKYFKEES
jgi:hypothetical protein